MTLLLHASPTNASLKLKLSECSLTKWGIFQFSVLAPFGRAGMEGHCPNVSWTQYDPVYNIAAKNVMQHVNIFG